MFPPTCPLALILPSSSISPVWSVGLFLSVPEWVALSSFINLLSGRCGSVHTEGSASKSRNGLDRLTSCLVLPKALPVSALKFPHPGKPLNPRQRETVGHPRRGTWDSKSLTFMPWVSGESWTSGSYMGLKIEKDCDTFHDFAKNNNMKIIVI